MNREPLFCRKCKHLKTYCTMNNPAGLYHYCELEHCELENKTDEAHVVRCLEDIGDGNRAAYERRDKSD